MRYYYTDPLKAAWMAKEFGFKFSESMTSAATIDYCMTDVKVTLPRGCEIEIHPDYYDMLKPQVGDMIEYKLSTDVLACGVIDRMSAKLAWSSQNLFPAELDNCRIIQRNNKAFFMPEIEE